MYYYKVDLFFWKFGIESGPTVIVTANIEQKWIYSRLIEFVRECRQKGECKKKQAPVKKNGDEENALGEA